MGPDDYFVLVPKALGRCSDTKDGTKAGMRTLSAGVGLWIVYGVLKNVMGWES
jgi:hypothetical protein